MLPDATLMSPLPLTGIPSAILTAIRDWVDEDISSSHIALRIVGLYAAAC